jgi:dTDP-4-dehydrorhamnose 3,5-epimerase/CDP-3, 6-dideoxy-D-glycero-D-glycero-4-hexulose-5-epimerase
MNQCKELLPQVWLIELSKLNDLRGSFVKTFSKSTLDNLNLSFDLREEYYSTSKKNVIRGMHFQTPPHDHVKIVYCLEGAVLDVLLDLRPGPAYGRVASVELDASSPKLLVIPKGVAHGFKSLFDGSLMVYKTSSEYSIEHDSGIRWDSINFDWGLDKPVISDRDLYHPTLKDFNTPFPEL